MWNNNLSSLINNQKNIDFDDFFSKEIYWSSKIEVDKIIDTIRHWEPEKLENWKKWWLTPEWEKQIERQVKKLKEFYKDEKITVFCDTSTLRIKETLKILKDKKYWLNLEIIKDDRLKTSNKEIPTWQGDWRKGWKIENFWQKQIKDKNYKNIIILWHSCYTPIVKSITDDWYDTLLLDFDELDHWESMHTRLDSENNSKSVLDWKLIINFSNFSEIKADLEKLGNKSLNSILNSNLDKNNVWNLLNNFFDRNFDFILNNFNEITNTDLKDFFIFKIYESWKIENKNDAIFYVQNEILKRDFKDLWNLLKIVDGFKDIDKNEVLWFIQNNKLNKNCLLLSSETKENLYEIWKNNKKISEQKKYELNNKIDIEINNLIKEIYKLVQAIPNLNKDSWNDTYVESMNILLEKIKNLKKQIEEFNEEKKQETINRFTNHINFNNAKEKNIEKSYFIWIISDFLSDSKQILNISSESLSTFFLKYLLYANLEWINKTQVHDISDSFKYEIVNWNLYFYWFNNEEIMKFYLLVNKNLIDWYQDNIWNWNIQNEKEVINFLGKYLNSTWLYHFSFFHNFINKVKKYFNFIKKRKRK